MVEGVAGVGDLMPRHDYRCPCAVMRRFAEGGGCVPTLSNGIIEACDGAFDASEGGEPIRFCPWCGKELAT